MHVSKSIKRRYFSAYGIKTVTPTQVKDDSPEGKTRIKNIVTKTVNRTESLKEFARKSANRDLAKTWFDNKSKLNEKIARKAAIASKAKAISEKITAKK